MSRAYTWWTAILAIALASGPALAQPIYKTVDENGNVVYSDTNPDGEGVAVTLKELSVVEPARIEQPQAGETPSDAAQEPSAEAADVGLRILSPQSEETIWNTAYVLSVQVGATGALPEGTELAYLVDGEVKQTSRSTSVQLDEVWRGEHQLSVEHRGPDGRVLGTAGPVTFFMRQGSANP
ncbi:MAG: DUF4124 domain-containing protein [Wenzhouxiangellaceae bacterium]|nr:DUF4124 domain-containing protein [Wenzhouxiangellaceae bacterium]